MPLKRMVKSAKAIIATLSNTIMGLKAEITYVSSIKAVTRDIEAQAPAWYVVGRPIFAAKEMTETRD